MPLTKSQWQQRVRGGRVVPEGRLPHMRIMRRWCCWQVCSALYRVLYRDLCLLVPETNSDVGQERTLSCEFSLPCCTGELWLRRVRGVGEVPLGRQLYKSFSKRVKPNRCCPFQAVLDSKAWLGSLHRLYIATYWVVCSPMIFILLGTYLPMYLHTYIEYRHAGCIDVKQALHVDMWEVEGGSAL